MNVNYNLTVLDDSLTWGIADICSLCRVDSGIVFEMINEGVLTPEGHSPETWRFNDLRVNLPGAALVLDLLEELEELRGMIRQIP
jgi:chaperone modulatory protein CbpM